MRGAQEFLVPPLLAQGATAKPPPASGDHFLLHFSWRSHGGGAPSPLWKPAELERGFMPPGVFHQLSAVCLGWSAHTAVGFEPSVGARHTELTFGGKAG